jgi:hypothetical protein
VLYYNNYEIDLILEQKRTVSGLETMSHTKRIKYKIKIKNKKIPLTA